MPRAITSISTCACATVTPGFRRATGMYRWSDRFAFLALSGSIGFQTSVGFPSAPDPYQGANPVNPAGITPTTVETTPSSRNVLPSASGSALNRIPQKALLMTTVWDCSWLSSARKTRPSAGCTPTKSKKF